MPENGKVDPDTRRVGNWQVSSFCSSGACVAVQLSSDAVRLRDTKRPEQTPLALSHSAWKTFLAGIRKTEFDL